MREGLLREALSAMGQLVPLSDPDTLLSAPEAEVRSGAHDFIEPNHDKDVRSIGMFPVAELAG